MPKEKKTKKQKLRSDLRKLSMQTKPMYSLQSLTKDSSVNEQVTQKQVSTPTSISTTGYKDLAFDLRKTLLVTFVIIIIQVLLHFFVIK